MIQISENWLGTELSLAYVLDALDRYREHPELFPPQLPARSALRDVAGGRLEGGGEDEDDEEESPLIQIEGSIGILNINGPLTSRESWLDGYLGITSYPAIARGMVELTDRFQAGEIDQIIHVFSTPGGDANGINGLTEVMQGCLAVAPNTISYTGSQALSAGYWLATVNSKLYTDKMAEVGSIGVISTITSVARRMEESGVDVKVVRSGKYKALLHPYEPISEAGVKEVEAKGAQFHGFFLDHVRSARPHITGQVGAWGEGQTFFGEEAIRMGLADGPVMSLNTLVNQIKNRHNSARKQNFDFAATTSAHRGPDMKPKVLFATAADQAAVAAGAALNAVPHEELPDDAEGETEPEPMAAQATVVETVATAEQIKVDLPAEPGLVAFLQGEIASLRAQCDDLKLQLDHAKQSASAATDAEAALAPIAREAIQRLQVALRQTPISLAGLPAPVLAAQYAAVRAEFERVMPVGMRAQSGHDESREPQDLGEQRLFLVK